MGTITGKKRFIAVMPRHGILSAEQYRQEAARVRREAARIQIDTLRQQLLLVAYDYEVMAETVEIIERQRQDISSERVRQNSLTTGARGEHSRDQS